MPREPVRVDVQDEGWDRVDAEVPEGGEDANETIFDLRGSGRRATRGAEQQMVEDEEEAKRREEEEAKRREEEEKENARWAKKEETEQLRQEYLAE